MQVQTSQPTLFELQGKLDRAIADVDYFKPRLKWRRTLDTVPNKKLTSTEKLVVNALQEQYFTNSNRKPGEDGFYRVHIGDNVIQTENGPKQLRGLGFWTGLDRQAVGDILKKLHAKGVVVRKEIPPSKEDITSRIYVRPTELFSIDGFNSLFDGDYGGKREKGKFKCRACGGYECEVKVTTTRTVQTTCTTCGDVDITKPETTIKKYTIDASEDDQEPETEHVHQSVHSSQPADDQQHDIFLAKSNLTPEQEKERAAMVDREFAWQEQQRAKIKEQEPEPVAEKPVNVPNFPDQTLRRTCFKHPVDRQKQVGMKLVCIDCNPHMGI